MHCSSLPVMGYAQTPGAITMTVLLRTGACGQEVQPAPGVGSWQSTSPCPTTFSSRTILTKTDLSDIYRLLSLPCLNRLQDWPSSGSRFLMTTHPHGRGGSGCLVMSKCWREISIKSPDRLLSTSDLVSDPPYKSRSRLDFDCPPEGVFLGLPVTQTRLLQRECDSNEFRSAKIVAGRVGDRRTGVRSKERSLVRRFKTHQTPN